MNADAVPHDQLIPAGTWIKIEIPDAGEFVGYTYLDPSAGFSAQGGTPDGSETYFSDLTIVRLAGSQLPWKVLTEAEREGFGLPVDLDWIREHYGEQPQKRSLWGWWRSSPELSSRFHPEAPDDLQVVVHDGGPRLTEQPPEIVWARVCGGSDGVFEAHVLNQPHNLKSVAQGQKISFVVPQNFEHAILTTAKYLRERPDWKIRPCDQCGLSELFDAPSDMMRAVFPGMPEGATMEMFSAFCPMCGGTQVVQHGESDAEIPEDSATDAGARPKKKKWWQIWK
ncbi:MAG: hypothetical protein NXI24_24785 [bacterium]|nr:hypothetical protein [bacterium]